MEPNRCNLLLLLLLSVSASCLGMRGKIYIEVENKADYKISIFRVPRIKGRDLQFELLPGEKVSEYTRSTLWEISNPAKVETNSLGLWPRIEHDSNRIIVELAQVKDGTDYRPKMLFRKPLELDPKNSLIINLQVNNELEKSIVTINRVLTLKELATKQIAEDIKKELVDFKVKYMNPLHADLKTLVEEYLTKTIPAVPSATKNVGSLQKQSAKRIAENIKAESNKIKQNILLPLPIEMREAVEDYLAAHQ